MAKRLNLDELHGRQPEAIVVRVGGKDIRLRHPDEFGPLELSKFQRAQNSYNALVETKDRLAEDGEEMAIEEVAEAMTITVDALIDIIGPELAGLSFLNKLQVFKFYTDQVAPPSEGNAGTPPAEQTGAASTQG